MLHFDNLPRFCFVLFFCSARAGGHLDHKIRTYVICVYDYFSSIFSPPFFGMEIECQLNSSH